MKVLFTGTGRCGTGYIAALFKELGFKTSHEEVFGIHNLPREDYKIPDEVDICCSWPARHFLKQIRAANPGIHVIHLIRDPIDTIESFLGIRFFERSSSAATWREWAEQQPGYPIVIKVNNPTTQAIRYWNSINWNLSQVCDTTVKIEKFTARPIKRITKQYPQDINITIPDALKKVPKDLNHRDRSKIDWSVVERPYCEGLEMIAEKFGYEVNIK